MAENKFEQNNFRDGIMSNGMTGRNETELYQRSVYSIIDGMPTPFGSIKNKTIFSNPQVGGFNEPLAGNDINWGEIFYGSLQHPNIGRCIMVILPTAVDTFVFIMKDGVNVWEDRKPYITEKTFFQIGEKFYIRVGGMLRIANHWAELLPVEDSYNFFEFLPTSSSKPITEYRGTSDTVKYYYEAGTDMFAIQLTPANPGSTPILPQGILEINGGKGSLIRSYIGPGQSTFWYQIEVEPISDTSRVQADGTIVTEWKNWDILTVYLEPYIVASDLVRANEMIAWSSRLVLAGIPAFPTRIFLSRVALYGDFSNYQNNPDEAIQLDVGFRGNINHLVSYDNLLIFTERNMYYSRFDSAVTPTEFTLKIGTDVSATDGIKPTLLNENLVFVNTKEDKLVLLNPNFNTYNYDYINLTLQVYGRMGKIKFIAKTSLQTDFLNNHLLIEAENGRFLLQIDRNENIISYCQIDNNLGEFKGKVIDETNEEWFFIIKDGRITLNSLRIDTSAKMVVKLLPQRVWFDGRSAKYYDKNVKAVSLKMYYRGNLSFYYDDKEKWSDVTDLPQKDPEAPKLFESQDIYFAYDEFVTIDNRSGKEFELYSVVTGIE